MRAGNFVQHPENGDCLRRRRRAARGVPAPSLLPPATRLIVVASEEFQSYGL